MKNLNQHQPYHLVLLSPWPFFTSFSMLIMIIGTINMFNFMSKNLFFLGFILTIMCSYQWWRDITRESTFQGFHTMKVLKGLKTGMILFIICEVFFFISFFWAYFHMFLTPSIEIGSTWPPFFINKMIINPMNLPLLNTILLISSGMFLSSAHYSMMKKNFKHMKKMMIMTIMFGMIFTYIQFFEYQESIFTINMSIYGTTFFILTGFHGIHVLIGTIFIYITFNRMKKKHFSNIHHFGFEASAWYWHFVDVVWLFLFLFIYWWPY